MRLITNSPWLAHTAPIFNRLKVMTIFEINKLQIACFMFKYIHINSLVILMTFLYKTVPYIVTTLDNLLTIIYLIVELKLDS